MKLELLAPAGSPASLRAAVEAGADSVYMGALWNARMRARNFTMDELEKAIAYCRKRKVKSYIVLNTLLFDNELAPVSEYIKRVYEAGADAFIVQDLGAARLVREIAPDMELHASTQMSLHNSAFAKILKDSGFTRAVLAREISAEQAGKIKMASKIETEVFAHGALCYSYSGKCLFSYVQTERSGNRGACAQLCRLPWRLFCNGKEVKTGYLTSTKDLNVIDRIPAMIAFGIDCVKIEGRLKDANYVTAIVSAYRKAIDSVPYPDLSPYTSRGYTRGYLFGDARKEKLTNPDGIGYSGTKVGEVVKTGAGGALIRLSAALSQGDSIRASRSGKIIEVFRIYDKNGNEIKIAKNECILKIKTLKPRDTIFKVERAYIEDSFLSSFKPEKVRTAKPFAITSEKLNLPAIPKLFFADTHEDVLKTSSGSVCVVPFDKGFVELAARNGIQFAIDTPRVVFDSEMDYVLKKIESFKQYKPFAFVVSELSLVSDYPTIISHYANITNSLSAAEWVKYGNVIGIIASIELPKSRAEALGFIHYNGKMIELMISENDLFRELEVPKNSNCELVDPNGNHFSIKIRNGRTVIEKKISF